MGEHPPRHADLPAGYDEDDPYADEDLASFPDWWQANATTFRSHNMRPYRPSRFADGAIVPEVLEELEHELAATVTLRTVGSGVDQNWAVTVDGVAISTLDRERTSEAFTRYGITATEFKALVREYIVEKSLLQRFPRV